MIASGNYDSCGRAERDGRTLRARRQSGAQLICFLKCALRISQSSCRDYLHGTTALSVHPPVLVVWSSSSSIRRDSRSFPVSRSPAREFERRYVHLRPSTLKYMIVRHPRKVARACFLRRIASPSLKRVWTSPFFRGIPNKQAHCAYCSRTWAAGGCSGTIVLMFIDIQFATLDCSLAYQYLPTFLRPGSLYPNLIRQFYHDSGLEHVLLQQR